jgi:hypothetical protein
MYKVGLGLGRWGIYTGKCLALKNRLSQSEGSDGVGQVRPEKETVDGSDPHGGHGYISEGDMALVLVVRRVSHWMVEIKILFIRWLSPLLKLV